MKRLWDRIQNEWKHPEQREFVFPSILFLLILILFVSPALRTTLIAPYEVTGKAVAIPGFFARLAESAMTLTLAVILMASIWAYSPGRRLTTISFVLYLVSSAAILVNLLFLKGQGRAALAYLPILPLLFIACYSLMKYLIWARKVSAGTLSGAVLCYLLLPMTFTQIYLAAWIIDPTSFKGLPPWTTDSGMSIWDYAVGTELLSSLQYFSMTTFTTLGYGDITPRNAIMRSMATGEAALGQIYVGIIVAKLVGLFMTNMASTNSDRQE